MFGITVSRFGRSCLVHLSAVCMWTNTHEAINVIHELHSLPHEYYSSFRSVWDFLGQHAQGFFLICRWLCCIPALLLAPSHPSHPHPTPPLAGLARRVSIYLDRSKQGGESYLSVLFFLIRESKGAAVYSWECASFCIPFISFNFTQPHHPFSIANSCVCCLCSKALQGKKVGRVFYFFYFFHDRMNLSKCEPSVLNKNII